MDLPTSDTPQPATSPEVVQAVQVLRRLLPPDAPTRRRAFAAALDELVGQER